MKKNRKKRKNLIKDYYLFRRRVPEKKNVLAALTRVHGINFSLGNYALASLGFSPYTRLSKIPLTFWEKSSRYVEKTFLIDRQLSRKKISIISDHVRNGSYKGMRFIYGLPVHGQRTHSNARTSRRLFRGMFSKKKQIKQQKKTVYKKKIKQKSKKGK